MNSIDFGVSMNDKVFEHKLKDGIAPSYCYWAFARGIPEGIGSGSKMWVANHGRWAGYFTIFNSDSGEVDFYSNSFMKIDKGERKPFQGYTLKVPKTEIGEKNE